MDPVQAAVIQVRGESMAPTLPDGCPNLADRIRTCRLDGHIYLLVR